MNCSLYTSSSFFIYGGDNLFLTDNYFIYDDFPSQIYGLRFVWIEKTPDVATTSDKSYTFIKNKATNSFFVSKSKHDSPLEFEAEILSDRVLYSEEVGAIYNKFFNRNKFCKLEFLGGLTSKTYINCIMTNPTRIEGGIGNGFGVIGFRVNVRCDAPWGWSDDIEISVGFKASDDEKTFSDGTFVTNYTDEKNMICEFAIFNNSDIEGYIYPEVNFQTIDLESYGDAVIENNYSRTNCAACICKELCSVGNKPLKASIVNLTDNPDRSFCLITDHEQYSLASVMSDGVTGIIRKNNSSSENLISKTNKKFIRLVPGENVFRAQGIREITFKFKEAKILV